jgi:hypothetical protein
MVFVNVTKLFFLLMCGMHFQPSLIFDNKAGAFQVFLSVVGSRLHLQGTNKLAYIGRLPVTQNSFITLTPGE